MRTRDPIRMKSIPKLDKQGLCGQLFLCCEGRLCLSSAVVRIAEAVI